jgi:ABC-2 type transport system ATP-binding protein
VPAYRLRVRPPIEPVVAALRRAAWVTSVEELPGHALRIVVGSLPEAERLMAGVLADSGASVVSLTPEAPDLEDVFLELTS